MQAMKPLTLKDLKPAQATFTLEAFPGKQFHLKKFALSAQIWCAEKFGEERLKEIFKKTHMPSIAQIVHYLLVEKEELPYADFLDNICTIQDKKNLVQGVLDTMGLSMPVVKQLQEEEDAKKAKRPAETSIGAPSSTPLPANTATPSTSS